MVLGNGIVRLVLVAEVARVAAMMVPLRMKLTTARPKPEFTKPPPVMVKLVGGAARSMGFGVMALTPGWGGGGRVSLTVSVVLPGRL